MKIRFVFKPTLLPIFFCFFITTCVQAETIKDTAHPERVEGLVSKNHKVHHHDARKLRKYTYSSLYWFILTSILYYKTQENYPWPAIFFGILALDNCINMLHYYHESQCAALEEERAFDIVRDYIKYHGKIPEYFIQVRL